MARIPTYDSQVTQVVAQKEFHVDSTGSAIVQGLTEGINDAANVVGAMAKYENAKEKEQYDLNSFQREESIINSSYNLQKENEKIREELAKQPNYQLANEKLKSFRDSVLKNPPENLDPASQKVWASSINKQFDDLLYNNIRWAKTESERLAKISKERMVNDLHNMGLDRYGSSGANHLPINENGLSLDYNGKPAEDYVLPKNSAEKAWQNENATEFFDRYLRETPLENPEKNNGIFFDMRTIEEKDGMSQRDNGAKQINDFFEETIKTIQSHPALDDKSKAYLESVAKVMKNQRTQEFYKLMDMKAQEKQREMSRPTAPFQNTIEYLNNISNRPVEMSVVEESKLFTEPADFTSILSVADEDVAYKYSTAPLGDTNFDAALSHAIKSMEFPTGEYTREQLHNKFAPNGTVMEVQALEQMLRNSDVKIVGEEIDAMKSENGFDESAWAYNAISEIASMPEGTYEEKTRKTAAANHILYQAQKEINGGNGFKDANLNNLVNAALSGIATDNGYTPAIIDDQNLTDLLFNQSFGAGFNTDVFTNIQKQKEWAIRNKGKSKASTEFLLGDTAAALETLQKTDTAVLQSRYKGLFDLRGLQSKVDNGKPAYFVYNSVPYKYLGHDSEYVYVEVAGIKQKLKMF